MVRNGKKMSICFNLDEYDLSVKDWEVLLNKSINNEYIVNGYILRWEYIITDNTLELFADVKKR